MRNWNPTSCLSLCKICILEMFFFFPLEVDIFPCLFQIIVQPPGWLPGTPKAGKEGRIVLTGDAWHCIPCKHSSLLICVLGPAGMELIFFVAAAIVICFRFVTKPSAGNAMVFYLWFCTASRLFFPLSAHLENRLGCVQEVGKGHNQADTPEEPKRYSTLYKVKQ